VTPKSNKYDATHQTGKQRFSFEKRAGTSRWSCFPPDLFDPKSLGSKTLGMSFSLAVETPHSNTEYF